jgi:hypothetical protein
VANDLKKRIETKLSGIPEMESLPKGDAARIVKYMLKERRAMFSLDFNGKIQCIVDCFCELGVKLTRLEYLQMLARDPEPLTHNADTIKNRIKEIIDSGLMTPEQYLEMVRRKPALLLRSVSEKIKLLQSKGVTIDAIIKDPVVLEQSGCTIEKHINIISMMHNEKLFRAESVSGALCKKLKILTYSNENLLIRAIAAKLLQYNEGRTYSFSALFLKRSRGEIETYVIQNVKDRTECLDAMIRRGLIDVKKTQARAISRRKIRG